jgi:ATP-dependent phosphofructokinase / diphosphate-dependent phosphofructokinase
MTNSQTRIAVLTGGGDCPGLNAVIRAVTKTAINDYGWEVLGVEDGFEGLIQPGKVRHLTLDDVRGILPRGGTILGTTNRANPFAYRVQQADGAAVEYDVSEDVVKRLDVLGVKTLIVIGGDGSLHIAQRLAEMGARIVGVPKTIDNDIGETDVTFGFDTAVATGTEAIDRLHTTAESHHRVMILEVMGRNAGWIAMQAGIAGGADVILIPEIPYELECVVDTIKARKRRGSRFSIIVIAEGAFPLGGAPVYQSEGYLGGATPRLGGIGEQLGVDLAGRLELEVRVTVLGHVQRGGTPTPYDRVLATRFGSEAVRLVARDMLGYMVSLRGESICAVRIEDAIRELKSVPLDGDLARTARSLGLCLGH